MREIVVGQRRNVLCGYCVRPMRCSICNLIAIVGVVTGAIVFLLLLLT